MHTLADRASNKFIAAQVMLERTYESNQVLKYEFITTATIFPPRRGWRNSVHFGKRCALRKLHDSLRTQRLRNSRRERVARIPNNTMPINETSISNGRP
jgi:hypothetical protein